MSDDDKPIEIVEVQPGQLGTLDGPRLLPSPTPPPIPIVEVQPGQLGTLDGPRLLPSPTPPPIPIVEVQPGQLGTLDGPKLLPPPRPPLPPPAPIPIVEVQPGQLGTLDGPKLLPSPSPPPSASGASWTQPVAQGITSALGSFAPEASHILTGLLSHGAGSAVKAGVTGAATTAASNTATETVDMISDGIGPHVTDPVKAPLFNAKQTFFAIAIILVEELIFDFAMKPSQQAQAGAQLDTFAQQIQQLITQIQAVINKIPQQALQSPAGQQFLQNMQQLIAGLQAIAAAHSQAGQVMQTSAQQTSNGQLATVIKTTALDIVIGALMKSLFGFWAALGVSAGLLAFMKLMSQKTDSSLNQMSSTVTGIQSQTTDATLAAMQTALGQLQQGAAQLQSIAAGANGNPSANPFLQPQQGTYDPYSAMNPTVGQLPPGLGSGGYGAGGPYGNGTGWNDVMPPGSSGSATGTGGGSNDDLSDKVVIDLDRETGKVTHVETPKGDYDIDINGQKIHIDDGSVSA